MNVGLTYNIKTDSSPADEEPPSTYRDSEAEWDDESTIDAVREALSQHHDVIPIEGNQEAFSKLLQFRSQIDIVFNIAEGLNGANREAHIPAMLEFLGIPYTGSDPLTLSLCLDKSRAKEILSYYKIPTARFCVIPKLNGSTRLNGLTYPLIVKPLHEGSSKGIFNDSLANNNQELQFAIRRILDKYGQPALIEEFIRGREFTIAILGNREKARVLPLIEIDFKDLPPGSSPIYSYEAKWVWDQPTRPLQVFQCPAKIDQQLLNDIDEICLRAYRALHCRDWCRIDVRLDENSKPYILELNPLPGILPDPEDNSCFPKAARAASMTYAELINTILNTACERYGLT